MSATKVTREMADGTWVICAMYLTAGRSWIPICIQHILFFLVSQFLDSDFRGMRLWEDWDLLELFVAIVNFLSIHNINVVIVYNLSNKFAWKEYL